MRWTSRTIVHNTVNPNVLTFIEGFNFVTYLAPTNKPVGIEKYEIESVDGDILVLTIEVYEEVVSDGSNNTVS